MVTSTIINDSFENLVDFRQWVKDNEWRFKGTPRETYYDREATLLDIGEGFLGKELQNMDPEEAWQTIKKGIHNYEHLDLIEKLENNLNEALNLKEPNEVPKKRLAYNDIGLGVFSFDRAAQGMYRLKELYSPTHNQVVQPEEVIRSAMEIRLKRDDSLVEERWEVKESGKPKLRTTNKKVWAYFPKVKRQRAAAEIYLSCGNYSEVSAEDFLYSGLVAIVIAKKLIAASIPVKINTVIGWEVFGKYTCAVVPVKHYHEPLDVNLLALTSSDPRFWRYEGFKACAILQLVNNRPTGGAGITGIQLKNAFEKAGYKTEVPNRFYFGRVANEQEAVSHVRAAIEQINKSLVS